jgi:CheY-like chemotaxis protein
MGGPILVVDDDDGLRCLIKMALEDEGYVVKDAANGKEALQLWEDYDLQLVLLDYMMPE